MGAGSVIIVLGPPNAGKGKQAGILAAELGGVHISTGNELRAQRDPRLRAIMASGGLVDSADMERVLEQALTRVPLNQPVVLDGVARKPGEAGWLLELLPKLGRQLDHVIVLQVEQHVAHRRSQDRGREDDAADKQDERWRRYREETLESIEIFRRTGRLTEVDGHGSVGEVADRIAAVIGL